MKIQTEKPDTLALEVLSLVEAERNVLRARIDMLRFGLEMIRTVTVNKTDDPNYQRGYAYEMAHQSLERDKP